jgi:type III secretion system FlhB-like substrate exporter
MSKKLIRGVKSSNKELAVALSYEQSTMSAPIVSAIAEQELAKLLQQMARRYGIPLVNDESLINKLSELEESQVIPRELYLEIAKIFSNLDNKKY